MFHIQVFHHLINRILVRFFIPIFFILLLTFSPVAVQPAYAVATIRYVAPGGSCGGVTPCYSSIQAAVNAAAAGDEIRVAAGTYTGVNTLGGKPQHLYINKNITVKGGYTTSNWTTPDPVANPTELQAQTLGRVIYVSGSSTIVALSGLRLTYGSSNDLGGHSPTSFENYDAGGGLYIYQSNVTVDHCRLTDNASPSDGYGGGIYIREGTLNITASQIVDNEAGRGGGAYLYKSQSQIGTTSEFSLNRATAANPGGVAISLKNGTLTLTNSTIINNTVTFGGTAGAVYADHAQFSIDNVEISDSTKSTGFSSFASDGTLQNSNIHHNDGTGVSINNNTVNILGNEISYNTRGMTIESVVDMDVIVNDNFIHHNQMTENLASASGGGIYLDARNGSTTLSDNIIQDNTAGKAGSYPSWGLGGGIYIRGTNATLESNLIQNNTAHGFIWAGDQYWGGHGGGIYINANPTLINNVITGNSAIFKGSGIYIVGGAPNLYQNTIADNSAGTGNDETGIYVVEESSTEKSQPKLWNTIIANQAVGIYNKGDVTSNIVFGDAILWYGNTSNTDGTGTFFLSNEHTGDPLFAAPGDYHINDGSAAIDNGMNANIPAGVTTDADGNPRIANGTVDLGAYENQSHFLLAVTLSGGGSGNVTSDPAGVNCGGDCSESYAANTVITLTATADPDSTFGGWLGDADCADGEVTLDSDITCTAKFFLPVTLTITKVGNGTGTVTSTPSGINCGADCNEVYDKGTSVTLQATAASGSFFTGWSGVADCADGNITLNADMTCTATFKKPTVTTFRSAGAQDGWILESAENSNTGGMMNAAAGILSLGDNAQKKQYRSILSFNTSSLPDNAVITKVTLKFKKQSVAGGGNPVTLFQGFMVDIKKGTFGTAPLALADFKATASKTVGPSSPALVSGWYSLNLTPAKTYINKLAANGGLTQMRLRFKLDDNNNAVANILNLISGNNATAANRPTLIIEYYVP